MTKLTTVNSLIEDTPLFSSNFIKLLHILQNIGRCVSIGVWFFLTIIRMEK